MNRELTYCHIQNGAISVNGKSIFTPEGDEAWTRSAYLSLGIDYPKFYKMDILAKMAFLGINVLERAGLNWNQLEDDAVAMVFANKHSSLATDLKYVDSYEVNGSPGPSLFVYTLPNILTGELAIFKKWYGENVFFIEEAFNPELFAAQINRCFRMGHKAVLFGWVDATAATEEAFIGFVTSDTGAVTATTLMNTYKQPGI